MQKQQYTEAERWLRKAERARYSLPDNGRRTCMLLSELKRRRDKSPTQIGSPRHLGSNLSTEVEEVNGLRAGLITEHRTLNSLIR